MSSSTIIHKLRHFLFKYQRRLSIALSALVLVLCLALFGYKVYDSWALLRAYEWKIAYIWLLPAFLLFAVQNMITVWVWRSILAQFAPLIAFRQHVKIYAWTTLARRIPAGILWMVAGRTYWYQQLDVPSFAAAAASFLEMVMVVLVGIPIGVLQLAGLFAAPWIGYGLFFLTALLILGVFVMQPDVWTWLSRVFKRDVLHIHLSRRRSLLWLGKYGLVWLLSGATLYVVIRLFYALPARQLPQIVGVWTLASLVAYVTSLTPSGFGVKELSLTYLLGFYLPEPLPLVVALVTRLLWTGYEFLFALLAVIIEPALNRFRGVTSAARSQ